MAELLYQGHGSLRLTTDSGKVIYVDSFAGEGYDVKADLILVTHQHADHNKINLPARKENCIVWQNFDALVNGEYKTLELGDVKIEAVEAYNKNHPKSECVGYIVSCDGITIYFAGDTSTTELMPRLADRKLDYAVLPADGIYNMDIDEAVKCAELIKAKHTIPVHIAPGRLFDIKRAEMFKTESRLIVRDGESIKL